MKYFFVKDPKLGLRGKALGFFFIATYGLVEIYRQCFLSLGAWKTILGAFPQTS